MGLIKDRRPRDWAYAVRFNEKELPSIQQMVKKINDTHNGQLIEDFNERCEQRLREGDPRVTKSEDLVTNPGLQSILNNALGTGVRMQYLELGTGTTAPTVSNTTLQTVISGGRIFMASPGRGWLETIGMKIFYGAIGNEAAVSFVATEVGIFNASSGGTMLNRSVFANNSVPHTQGIYGTIWSVVVEFCPVT